MDYKIPFRGLKEGKHHYEYHIDDKFFDPFEEGDIKQGQLTAEVDLIRRTRGIESTFTIDGIVKVACDRCLDEFDCPIEFKGKLFFEFGIEHEEVSDELVMLAATDNYLDLDKYIYEFICLSMPIQKVHPNDEEGYSLCNAEMLEKLDNMIVNNDDDEIDDPRWDSLRDLIN